MATVRTPTKTRATKGKGNRKRKPEKVKAEKARPERTARAKAEPRARKSKSSGPSFGQRLVAIGGNRSGDVGGVLALGTSVFLLLSLLSLQLASGMWMGPFGRSFAVLTYSLFGIGSHLLAALGVLISVRMLMQKQTIARSSHIFGAMLVLMSAGVLLHLVAASYRVAGYGPGGILGQDVAELCRALVSTAGTALVGFVGLLIGVVIATPLRMRSILVFFGGASKTVGQGAFNSACRVGQDAAKFSGEVIRAVLPERDHDEYLDDEYDEDEYYDDEEELEAEVVDPPIFDARSGPVSGVPAAELAGDTEKVAPDHMQAVLNTDDASIAPKKGKARAKKTTKAGFAAAEVAEAEAEVEVAAVAEIIKPTLAEMKQAAKDAKEAEAAASSAEPLIVESQFQANAMDMKRREKEAEGERLDFIKLHAGDYKLPSLDLLAFDENRVAGVDKKAMLELSAKLVQTLENYGVKGHVAAIRPGPVVTMYEFAPAPGTRLNKIVNLSDDLAMSLKAMKVRIVAPLPGKAAVGIEVPNTTVEMVYLKEIIADESFRDEKISLPMALGKNIEGAPISVDLAKMPHLLVAGTTGSGKSVSVNSMITSLLYHCSPEEVRMIMIDPKMLELSIYEGIPHLLLPVVTDPKKANLALRWAVDEMERRYGLLASMGVRDIRSYNSKLTKKRAKWEASKLQRMADEAQRLADDGDFEEVESTEVGQSDLPFGREDEPGKNLPFIVVIIDEFADLIMCAPKEVETSVARIAQKARAAGIHLILATQRPSVDVITGLIKANFPSRIAFRVSSKVDSRTILDGSGAENLLGSGDMLFCDRGASPVRLHGCYVDEDEIHQVVEFLKTQGQPVYNLDIVKPREDEEDDGGSGGGAEADGQDDLYDKAVVIVAEAQRVSVSYLQRRLSVGYNRSAKLVERMEREGVVSAPDNKKQREVLIQAA